MKEKAGLWGKKEETASYAVFNPDSLFVVYRRLPLLLFLPVAFMSR
jgi:hypothetical protein